MHTLTVTMHPDWVSLHSIEKVEALYFLWMFV
jgi:hypothetical protein